MGDRSIAARARSHVAAGRATATAVLERDRQAAGSVLGGAIAFRLFMFVVPLMLFLVGLVGFLDRQVDEGHLESAGIAGTLAVQIDAALRQPGSTRWIAVGLGLLGMGTTGRTLSTTMAQSSCLAWRLPVRPKASVGVIGAMIGLMVGIGFVAVVVNALRHHFGLGAASVSFAAAAAVYGVAWMVMSGLLPRATSDPGALLPGGIIVGVTLAAMQAVSQLYLPRRLANASEVYGAMGIAIVALGWFFIAARAMVMSIVADAVVYERFGSVSRAVFALPGLRRLPRHWPSLGRLFQLEADDR